MFCVKKFYEDENAFNCEKESIVVAWETEDEFIDINNGYGGELKLCLGKFPNDTFVVPNGIESIGAGVFANPIENIFESSIKKLIIPESVKEIKSGAFEYTAINEVEIHPNSSCGVVKDNAIFSKDGKKLIWILKATGGEYVVPNGVEVIANVAFDNSMLFENNEGIETLVVPASVKKIELGFECDYLYTCVTIKAPKGSYAIEFAKENEINYEEI